MNWPKIIKLMLFGVLCLSLCISVMQLLNCPKYDDYFMYALNIVSTKQTLLPVIVSAMGLLLVGFEALFKLFFGELSDDELENIRECLRTRFMLCIILIAYQIYAYNRLSYVNETVLCLGFSLLNLVISSRCKTLLNRTQLAIGETAKFLLIVLVVVYTDVFYLYNYFSVFVEDTLNGTLTLDFIEWILLFNGFLEIFLPAIHFILELIQRATFSQVLSISLVMKIGEQLVGILKDLTPVFLLFFLYRGINPTTAIFCFYYLSSIGRKLTHIQQIFVTSKTLKSLPVVTKDHEALAADSLCAICLLNMEEGLQLRCKHIMHRDCLWLWALNNQAGGKCPKCLQSINGTQFFQRAPAEAGRNPQVKRNFQDKPNLSNDQNIGSNRRLNRQQSFRTQTTMKQNQHLNLEKPINTPQNSFSHPNRVIQQPLAFVIPPPKFNSSMHSPLLQQKPFYSQNTMSAPQNYSQTQFQQLSYQLQQFSNPQRAFMAPRFGSSGYFCPPSPAVYDRRPQDAYWTGVLRQQTSQLIDLLKMDKRVFLQGLGI